MHKICQVDSALMNIQNNQDNTLFTPEPLWKMIKLAAQPTFEFKLLF